MADYVKTRTKLADGKYDIENTGDFTLVDNLVTEFPGVSFNISCNASSATITTSRDLTSGEQTDLDTCLATCIASKVLITE